MAFYNVITTLTSVDKLFRNLLDYHDFSTKNLSMTLGFLIFINFLKNAFRQPETKFNE
ncbi:MAG: hypothetical protein IKI11_02265 [Neisseriaceae bacterium]|nr:hypothetical protein [Neisseriaceae bacterium]